MNYFRQKRIFYSKKLKPALRKSPSAEFGFPIFDQKSERENYGTF
jgi:hypothetical protein